MDEYKEERIRILENILLPSVDTSNIIVDTSNIIVDTSNIIVDTSNIIVE